VTSRALVGSSRTRPDIDGVRASAVSLIGGMDRRMSFSPMSLIGVVIVPPR
jgi:hypothetical protein